MAAPRLRLYPAPDTSTIQEPSVRVSLRDILPLIAVAQRRNHLWLHDFLEDEVAVTPDLYEILRAFRSQRPSA